MKSKQTLKVVERLKNIIESNCNSEGKLDSVQFLIEDLLPLFYVSEVSSNESITPKKSKWKYSREEIMNKPNKQKTDWEKVKEQYKDWCFYNKQHLGRMFDSEAFWDFYLKQTLQQQREDLIKETKIDLEDEYNNGFEDGVEQANKHLKKDLLSEIESKSVFVKAYKNGPILADSLIITFDDWLELKSGRKSKISYKNLETNLEKK